MNTDPKAWATLGRAIQQARQARRLSQEELAAAAGVSLTALQGAEAGRVPKKRMPYTLVRMADALGWPTGTIEEILAGGAPPGEWKTTPVQQHIPAGRLESIISGAMVRAIDSATSAEIRAATKIALDTLRAEGYLNETD